MLERIQKGREEVEKWTPREQLRQVQDPRREKKITFPDTFFIIVFHFLFFIFHFLFSIGCK